MRFVKYHGHGNDYLVLEDAGADGEQVGLTPMRVFHLCHRHTGLGADGILEPLDGARADLGLRIWNPDGSVAEKSGNGLRIFARWAVERRGAPNPLRMSIHTGEIVRAEVDGVDVQVEMGRASFEPADVPCELPLQDSEVFVVGAALRLTAVGLGNPHCVVFVEGALDKLPWRSWGSWLETAPFFPNRTNVQVARVCGVDRLEARIWERGAGETSASGSSACAVAAAAVRTGRLPAGLLTVQMPGGSLAVTVSPDFELTLRGPVAEVAELTVLPDLLARLRGSR